MVELSLSLIQSIGNALGLPLAIALVVIAMTLKNHAKRLEDGDKRMTAIENKHQESEALLQAIRADVAFIRGKLEPKE